MTVLQYNFGFHFKKKLKLAILLKKVSMNVAMKDVNVDWCDNLKHLMELCILYFDLIPCTYFRATLGFYTLNLYYP